MGNGLEGLGRPDAGWYVKRLSTDSVAMASIPSTTESSLSPGIAYATLGLLWGSEKAPDGAWCQTSQIRWLGHIQFYQLGTDQLALEKFQVRYHVFSEKGVNSWLNTNSDLTSSFDTVNSILLNSMRVGGGSHSSHHPDNVPLNSLRRPFTSQGETTSFLGNRESIGKVPERRTILILSFLISHTAPNFWLAT